MKIETIKHYFKQLTRFINVRYFDCDSCQREFERGVVYSLAYNYEEFENYPIYCEYCREIAKQELNQAQEPENPKPTKTDKRTLNKTGRTHQLGTRVRKEFLKKLKSLARKEKLKYVEVLEKALDCYAERKKKQKIFLNASQMSHLTPFSKLLKWLICSFLQTDST